MNTLLITAGIIALAFAMLLSLISLVGMGAWHLIYHVMGCRKAPIQKWMISTVVCIWVIGGAIISLLP